MTEALITIAREYIEDETSPYAISDTIIERIFNQSRQSVYDLFLLPEESGGRIYDIGHKYLMNVTLTTDGTTAIGTDDYTLDVFNGIITFDSAPSTSVYATFTEHDFYNAVAEIWKYRAAKARFSGDVKLGDEVIPQDKYNREYCIGKYWNFRVARTIQAER
jgi:hypothetical protein